MGEISFLRMAQLVSNALSTEGRVQMKTVKKLTT